MAGKKPGTYPECNGCGFQRNDYSAFDYLYCGVDRIEQAGDYCREYRNVVKEMRNQRSEYNLYRQVDK